MQVNEDIRKKMFALRQTWNDVFPPAKLYTLDVKVNAIDINWPISAQKISPAIHVNPNFFSTTVRVDTFCCNRLEQPQVFYNYVLFCVCSLFFITFQTEKDIQTELQIKQRELLELKKRKLELELAATQKQLGLAPTTVAQPPHTAMVDPNELLKRDPMQPCVPLVPKPVNIITQPAFIPNQIPTSNVRTRIAPVNPALVSSVRSRDPRLMRQTLQTVPIPPSVITQSINEHIQQHKLPPSM